MRQDLIELAERAKKATGPDRELDRDIADAFGLGPPPDWSQNPRKQHKGCINLDCGSWISPEGNIIWHTPFYTASIDAALSLLKKRWSIRILSADDGAGWLADVWQDDTPDGMFASRCATPALALVAAICHALAEEN